MLTLGRGNEIAYFGVNGDVLGAIGKSEWMFSSFTNM